MKVDKTNMTVDMCGECSQFEYSLQDFRHGFLSSSDPWRLLIFFTVSFLSFDVMKYENYELHCVSSPYFTDLSFTFADRFPIFAKGVFCTLWTRVFKNPRGFESSENDENSQNHDQNFRSFDFRRNVFFVFRIFAFLDGSRI